MNLLEKRLNELRERHSQKARPEEVEEGGLESTSLRHWKERAELQSAANDGDAEAQYQMGSNYLSEEMGFERNPTVALSWFRRGAAGGNVQCKSMIPVCNYLIGMSFVNPGEEEKATRGIPFWQRALEGAEYLEENMRCDCYFQMAAAYFAAGQPEEAQKQMAYPLEHRFVKAYLYMAKAWENGLAGPPSPEKAFGYYLEASRFSPEQGLPVMQEAYKALPEGPGALPDDLRQKVEEMLGVSR